MSASAQNSDLEMSRSHQEIPLFYQPFHGPYSILVSSSANTCILHQTDGHLLSNELLERAVQTIKRNLKASTENKRLHLQLKEILFRYRATPLKSGQTSAELYLHRKIRTKLDAICSPVTETRNTIQQSTKVRQLQVGDRVQARYYTLNAKPT